MDSIRNAVLPEETTSLPAADVTAEDNSVDDLLEDLNTRFALSVLPVILYLAILLLLGLVGNILSFVVYRKFKPSSTRTYILALSLLDLSNNIISYPTSIAELCFRYTFDNPWLCRVFRFVKSSQVLASAFVLVAVALDRHRRVCQSLKKQQEAGDALRASVICVVVGTLLSLPYGAVTGRQTIPTGTGNLTGFMCSVDDQHKSSVLLLSYNAITGLAFVTCFTTIAVSYTRIGCHVWRHRKHVVGLNQAATAQGRSLSTSGDTSSTPQTQSSATTDVTTFITSETSHRPAETQGVKIDAAGATPTILQLARLAGYSEITSQPASADSRPVAFGCGKDQTTDEWDATGVVCTTPQGPAVSASLTDKPEGHYDKEEVILDIPSTDGAVAVTNIDFHNHMTVGQGTRGAYVPGVTTPASQTISPTCDTLLKSDTLKTGVSLSSPSLSSDQQEIGVKTPVSGRRRSSDDHVAAVRALSRKRTDDVKITSQKGGHVKEVASRTTLIMFMLTLVFVLSFLPYWALVFLRGALRFSEHGMQVWVFNVYLLGLHSFFISSATNAIVYGVFSAQFRRECQRLLGACVRRR